MAQMYACGLSKAKLLEDWEETANKSWGGTHPHFTGQFNKARHKIEQKKSQKNYEISTVFCKDIHPHTLNIPQGGATATTIYSSFTAEMGYSAALEDKDKAQAERIIDLEARVDGKTVLTDTTNYAASAVAIGTNKELNDTKTMM